MKTTNSFYVCGILLLLSASMMLDGVSAAWGWGSFSSSSKDTNTDETIKATATATADAIVTTTTTPTVINNQTLQSIIDKDLRFVVYNSRRLTGECLPICTDVPKDGATEDDDDDDDDDNTDNSPTGYPTSESLDLEEQNAMEGCLCEAGDYEWKQSWKCGNDIYVCPGIDTICGTQGSQNSLYYRLSDSECEEMKAKKIDDKCIELPDHGITKAKGLSNRVCYKTEGMGVSGMKQDAESCDTCTYRIDVNMIEPPKS